MGYQEHRAFAEWTSLYIPQHEPKVCPGVTTLDYPPGSYADTAELVALSREAVKLGGIYHTHVRYSLGDRFLDPFEE